MKTIGIPDILRIPPASTCVRRLSRAFVFSGRAPRTEFWSFILLSQFVFWTAASVLVILFGNAAPARWAMFVLTLGVFVPSLAVGVRRIHDTGRTGWWTALHVLLAAFWALTFLFFEVFSLLSGNELFLSDLGLGPKVLHVFSRPFQLLIMIFAFGTTAFVWGLFYFCVALAAALIPVSIVVLVFLGMQGERSENRFGPVC